MRLSPTNIQSAGLWGGTAVLGGLWLTQPFGYLRSLMGGSPAEEESEQASGGQPPAPEEPAEKEAEDDKAEDNKSSDVDEDSKQEGGKSEGGEKGGESEGGKDEDKE
ncbi:hypothetical protein CVIRNUC_002909 [Coccomyxa viridis]|uniref:Uncharacterized protein n=1 Tax=Coccomyxa viridis TaxID=1274662 RepID=A0AAV1I1E7_9CHLO|nr:hypothetical protein CVIRNUC_002909 [Coccomyxa viridis]